jgi:holo-[acyl-carrier protein] synthase
MRSEQLIHSLEGAIPGSIGPAERVGIDLVHIPRIAESLQRFGKRFQHKLFTADEIAYCTAAPAHADERFAARFAAKEATIKALRLSNTGVSWRDMEVRRHESGECSLQLHGRAAAVAHDDGLHPELLLCLSHDGDYAAAVVMARRRLTQQ